MRYLARQKYIFDQGMLITSQLSGIVSNSILIALAGDKFKYYLHVKSAWTVIIIAALGYISGTWILGYLLDKFKFTHHYQTACNDRNAAWSRIERESL